MKVAATDEPGTLFLQRSEVKAKIVGKIQILKATVDDTHEPTRRH